MNFQISLHSWHVNCHRSENVLPKNLVFLSLNKEFVKYTDNGHR